MAHLGRNVSFVPVDWVRVRFFVLSLLVLVASLASVGAQAQTIAPPNMTFTCTPDPIYVGASATCTAHVGGGATGSVSLSLGPLLLQTIPLDSNGDAVATTAAFGPGPGIYVVTAAYSGDSQYQATQRDLGLTVYSGQVIITAETLVCSPYLVSSGNPISCTMHLPAGATGTVNFIIAGGAWTTATIDQNGDAVATNGLQGAAVGDYRIDAAYSGDTNFAPATASTTAVVIPFKPEPNSMSVGCSPAPLVVGNSGSCSVHVGGGVTGSVDLYVHDQYQSTTQLDSSGSATIANLFGTSPAGSYSVRAVYTGDVNFDSASAATTVNINTGSQTPTLTVVCNPTALSPGSGTNCTAQAPAGATGQILFYVSGNYWTTVSVDANGVATGTSGLSNLPVGTYSVIAYYPGDQNFTSASAGTTVPVQTAKPVPSVNVSCTPTALVNGSVTTCTASVGQGATGPVLFGLPGQPTSGLSLDSNGNVVFQNQLSGVSPGSYTLQASYSGDINFAPASATTTVTVSSQQSTPVMSPSVTPTMIRSGDSVRVAVNVSGGATGSVELLVNGAHYVTMPLDPSGSFVGAANVTPSPQNGSWFLTFNYSGDVNYLPVSQTVQLTAVTNPLTLNCAPGVISSGGSTSCTAQVVGVTTGTISLYLDGALQGTNGVDQSGSVVITVPATSLPLGSHTVTASYFLDDQTLSGTATQSISVTGSGQSGYNYSITDSNGNSGYAANGNVVTYTDSVNGTWSNLGYDSLNRLSVGSQTPVSGSPLFFCWSYDSFGNRVTQALSSQSFSNSPGSFCQTSGTLYSNIVTTPNANNQIQNSNASGTLVTPGYDAAGNVTYDGSNQYLYDDEGRVCAVQTTSTISAGIIQYVQYIYDAEGHRVAKGTINSLSCDLSSNGFIPTNSYALDQDGQQVTETDNSGHWLHTNIYAMGQLLATYDDQGVHFHISDWLGSRRMQTDYQGNTEATYTNLPFGEMPPGQSLGATEHHFTGKERDAESGLDYFGARYYASNMGRWMSPDWADKPEAVPYSSLDNPQSLNLYGYVGNNPLSRADKDGHCCSDDFNSFSDHPGRFTGGSDPMDAKFAGAVAGGTLTAASFAYGVGEIETAGAGALFALKTFVKTLGVTGTGVAGVTTAVGALTGTDTSKATDMVTNVTNPIAGAAAAVTNNSANGPVAADLATIAGAAKNVATGKGVGNPAEVAKSISDQRSTISNAISGAVSTVKGFLTPPPPPPPAPKPPDQR